MNLACALSTRRIVEDPDRSDGHIETCLRCQVEAIRFRHLARRLSVLRTEVLAAPPGLHAAVMADLRDAGATKKSGSREAAAAVAGLAAAVGAVALWRRSASA